MSPLSKVLLHDIHLSHAKQLAQFEVPRSRNAPQEDAPPTLFADTINWIKANKAAVQAAQAARQCAPLILVAVVILTFATECRSPNPNSPNWDTVFFSLMESDAVYLRYAPSFRTAEQYLTVPTTLVGGSEKFTMP